MSELRRVIDAALNENWAIHPDKLATIAEVLALHATGGTLTRDEIEARIGDRNDRGPQAGAGVAVLPLHGTISHRMGGMSESSGGVSTERFGQWFKAAMADPGVGSIVLDVDSPGGGTKGVRELADMIYAARGVKSVVAIANGMMASAAYWIASAAEGVWATPSADVGSIGVYTMHDDLSKAMEDRGVKRTVISAGKHKVEGNPYGPLGDDAKANIQARVDEEYDAFVAAVARHRGVDEDVVREGYGEGRALSATKARREGMVDKVGAFDTLLGKMGAGSSRARLKAADLTPVITAQTDNGLALIASATESGGAVGAATPVVLDPPETAAEAKELRMPDNGTPAAPAVDPAVHAATQAAAEKATLEAARTDGLLAIAAENDVPASKVREWREGGTTVAEANAELLRDLKSKAKPGFTGTARVIGGGEVGTEHGPFASFGEQLMAIRNYTPGQTGGAVDKLMAVQEMYGAASGASATSGPDGGFLIQTDFAADLMKDGKSESVLASRCSTTEISANADSLEVTYIDETSRATGSRWGGVQVFRAAEADTVTAKKPKLGKWESRLEDLRGLFYSTNRLDRDARAMGQVVGEAFRDEFAFTIDNEIFRGTGTAQCLGVTTALDSSGAGPTITVAKETGQAADTIVAENILKMWSRVNPRSRTRGVWVYNAECDVQLAQMQIGTGTSAQLVFMPPTGLSGSPYGTIYGRPVIPIEQASALGDLGDIAFLDLSKYKLITKGGIQEDSSPHVRFIYWENTLRWNVSINGAPMDKSALTPFKGNTTTSPFVVLAAR
ncbi:MAG: phage major capsid protein [Mycobacterium sp.]